VVQFDCAPEFTAVRCGSAREYKRGGEYAALAPEIVDLTCALIHDARGSTIRRSRGRGPTFAARNRLH
jgi:hypothetical protein